MIISVNWLKKFVPELPEISELSRLIGARLVEIEDVIDLGEKYKDVIIAKVVSAQKVENSDHLNLCKIDDGGVREGANRDEDGFIQIVCGAPNVREGIFIAWLPPESIVPETYGSDEEFKLGARKLMGNMSNGMIASLRELGLGDDHDGILEITQNGSDYELKAGVSFAKFFELDDYLLEVENKSLTHRPDCFGIIGFAREVAGILGQDFQNPDWFISPELPEVSAQSVVEPEITIQSGDVCDRYQAIVMSTDRITDDGMTTEKTYLLRSGMRPISKVVDVTNYLMLLSGQPLHAFDYDKLLVISGGDRAKITVRTAVDGEELELIDNRKIKLSDNDIVVAAGDEGGTVVALAGAMGGKNTEIDESTKNIIIESATFNLYNLRNTQMRHGIFSEAITRFTKGQPAGITEAVLCKAVQQLGGAGAETVSQISGQYPAKANNLPIEISESNINDLLGTDFSRSEIIQTLENVGFMIEVVGEDMISVISPYWRTDIHISEDIIEEVGRLNGYDNIALELPKRTFTAVDNSKTDQLQRDVRNILTSAGANELLTYTFVHGDLIKSAGQDVKNSYRITNSISPDLQYYRQSLTPSLLAKVNQNIRSGFDKFAIFEINKVSPKNNRQPDLNNESVPRERKNLAFSIADKKGQTGFYEAKKYLDFIFKKLNLNIELTELDGISDLPINTPFEPKRSATVYLIDEQGERLASIGVIGEYRKSVSNKLKLPDNTAGFELEIADSLIAAWVNAKPEFKSLSKYQSVERDISLKIDKTIRYSEVLSSVKLGLPNTGTIKVDITPLDIYSDNDETKTVTLRFIIMPYDKTLSGDDIKAITERIEEAAKNKLNAEIV